MKNNEPTIDEIRKIRHQISKRFNHDPEKIIEYYINKTGGGILYEPNDSDTLTEALSSLLLNPDRARQLAQQGRKIVFEQFGVEHMAENIIEVYSEILDNQ